jgi:hypothetical protein
MMGKLRCPEICSDQAEVGHLFVYRQPQEFHQRVIFGLNGHTVESIDERQENKNVITKVEWAFIQPLMSFLTVQDEFGGG